MYAIKEVRSSNVVFNERSQDVLSVNEIVNELNNYQSCRRELSDARRLITELSKDQNRPKTSVQTRNKKLEAMIELLIRCYGDTWSEGGSPRRLKAIKLQSSTLIQRAMKMLD